MSDETDVVPPRRRSRRSAKARSTSRFSITGAVCAHTSVMSLRVALLLGSCSYGDAFMPRMAPRVPTRASIATMQFKNPFEALKVDAGEDFFIDDDPITGAGAPKAAPKPKPVEKVVEEKEEETSEPGFTLDFSESSSNDASGEAPESKAPEIKAPAFEAPKFEAPKFEAPKIEAPEMPKFEMPKFEMPAPKPKPPPPPPPPPPVKAPEKKAPEVKAPAFEAPKIEAPKMPAFSMPKFEMPAPKPKPPPPPPRAPPPPPKPPPKAKPPPMANPFEAFLALFTGGNKGTQAKVMPKGPVIKEPPDTFSEDLSAWPAILDIKDSLAEMSPEEQRRQKLEGARQPQSRSAARPRAARRDR